MVSFMILLEKNKAFCVNFEHLVEGGIRSNHADEKKYVSVMSSDLAVQGIPLYTVFVTTVLMLTYYN